MPKITIIDEFDLLDEQKGNGHLASIDGESFLYNFHEDEARAEKENLRAIERDLRMKF